MNIKNEMVDEAGSTLRNDLTFIDYTVIRTTI